MADWTLDDIAWARFDRSRVDANVLEMIKAVTMVERNGAGYAAIMGNLFAGDPNLQAAARNWAEEEGQHGRALARWVTMADPNFDCDGSYRRFTEVYPLPLEQD